MIIVRIANSKDAKHIAKLGSTTFTESFGHLFRDKNDLTNYLEKTFSIKKINASILKPNNIFFIAFVDETPVGYAKLKLNSASEFLENKNVSQLQKIYVLKEYLSMRIGFQLQNLLFKTAQFKGSNVIWLSVYEDNLKAIHFYEKNDFKQIGSHQFSIGKEGFLFIAMAKEFNNGN
jgi:ribosomal protein S18 acetylase RimI-like enzyme